MNPVCRLARPEIAELDAYVPAESGLRWIRLNANESPWPGGERGPGDMNRYPDGRSAALTNALAAYYEVEPSKVLVTRGSDDAIDLLVRTFCAAGRDSVLTTVPGFSMYAIAARVQGAGVVELELPSEDEFRLRVEALLDAWRPGCKLVFLCSPNNPTGTLVREAEVLELCKRLADRALVVLDEAYAEFASTGSLARLVSSCPNLCVLRTLSKAHGLAGSRVGALLADAEVLGLVSRVLPPYPLARSSQQEALAALEPAALRRTAKRIAELRLERDLLAKRLQALPCVRRVWPSEANFLLLQTDGAADVLRRCRRAGILVRDCSSPRLPECVRVTIGSKAENRALLAVLAEVAHAV